MRSLKELSSATDRAIVNDTSSPWCVCVYGREADRRCVCVECHVCVRECVGALMVTRSLKSGLGVTDGVIVNDTYIP